MIIICQNKELLQAKIEAAEALKHAAPKPTPVAQEPKAPPSSTVTAEKENDVRPKPNSVVQEHKYEAPTPTTVVSEPQPVAPKQPPAVAIAAVAEEATKEEPVKESEGVRKHG